MSYAGVLNAGAEVDKVRRSIPPPLFFAPSHHAIIIIIIIVASPKTLFYAHT